ncbi:hypothetical protein KAR91_50570 [Candidatus Pacearchaeota archaeon]|nr:hypothetical protein [Candidatus Pacearchaeota archaeon]
MNADDLGPNTFFTTTGKDVWKMLEYCHEPTCILENLETKKREHFGMGGITAQSFQRVAMPIDPKETEK